MWHAAVHMLLKSTYYIYGGQWWRRRWAIECQLVIGHRPIHSDRLHPPITTNWWMIDQRSFPMWFYYDEDDGYHGWMIPIIGFVHVGGSLNRATGGIMKGRGFQFIPQKKKITPCKKLWDSNACKGKYSPNVRCIVSYAIVRLIIKFLIIFS